MNLVEMVADPEDVHWDQPCKYGCRIDVHAVYCHNLTWMDAPRKCRRSWYTGDEVKDEDCPGFKRNEGQS